MPTYVIQEPTAVRVFGILHLILAGIGFLSGIWSLFADQVNGFLMSANNPAFEVQTEFMREITGVNIMKGVFMLVLAGLLLTSGLLLVRSRPAGVTWSHRYAWASIASKVISLVVTVAVVLPAMGRMMDDAGLPPGAADPVIGFMKSFTAIATVATPLISCLYPALALYFLSRPQVKEWTNR